MTTEQYWPACDRCGVKTWATVMSYFNTDVICFACRNKEREHPDYEKARTAEENAVKAGNLNFPGIGLPSDLR